MTTRPTPAVSHLQLLGAGAVPPAAPTTADELFRRYGAYVATVAHRVLGGPSDVDDVVQDVFAVVIKKVRIVRGLDSPRQWLASVTVKRARQVLRWRRVRARFAEMTGRLGAEPIGPWGAGHPAASPESRRMIGRLYDVLDRLPTDERIAWILRYIEQESVEEAAKILGCSARTVKRRTSAAQRVVREVLGDESP